MFHSGLVSVTFRQLSCEEIVKAVQTAGLEGIEWGGDIHVPAGNLEKAKTVRQLTQEAGLISYAYGSYFRLLQNETALSEFEAIAQTAHALGAPVIRVWAGQLSSKDADKSYFTRAVEQTRQICAIAARYNITVCFEYHRNTLTDNRKTALRLVKETGTSNLGLYWQPNPDLTEDENLNELQDILPFVKYVHVFHWDEKGGKLDLQGGEAPWLRRLAILKAQVPDCVCMLEFVKEDSVAQFMDDARALKEFITK